MGEVLSNNGFSAEQDKRKSLQWTDRKRHLIGRFTVLLLTQFVLITTLFSLAEAGPQERSFPVVLAGRKAERKAFMCAPNGPGPFAAVVFNHGSIVDMMGWPGASGRGYCLDCVCEKLAEDGFFVFAPIRENSPRGRGFQSYEDDYRTIVSQAVDYIKTLQQVNASRIALVGFSMGGLISFKVSLERNDLRAVALLAPAFGRGLLGEAARNADRLTSPVLVMVEKSDNEPIMHGVALLEKALKNHAKPHQVIRYDRGGGHTLFYDVGYWWDDFRTFLTGHLSESQAGHSVIANGEAGKK